MRGEVDTRFLNTIDATHMINIWQLFLLDDAKYRLMQHFNNQPTTFNFDDVFKAMQTLPNMPDTNKTNNPKDL